MQSLGRVRRWAKSILKERDDWRMSFGLTWLQIPRELETVPFPFFPLFTNRTFLSIHQIFLQHGDYGQGIRRL